MKALCLMNETDAVDLAWDDNAPKPNPSADEILVRVLAAGVTPTELGWYPTRHAKTGELRKRPIPGHEFSGTVAAVGSGVAGVAVGDEIFGMNDWFADGGMAEYCVTLPCSVAPKPLKLTHAEAASVPISALTAWQGLFGRLNLLSGDHVFVQGGAGAVGVYAIQMAHSAGAYVVTTAMPHNFDFLKGLGADEVLDYRTDYFAAMRARFDSVFDVVGGDTLQRSWDLLKPTGRMVTIASNRSDSADERTKNAFLLVEVNQRHLLEIAAMMDTGQLQTVVDTVIPPTEAISAYTGKLATRRGRGKVVVEMNAGD
jgi:NADPH:quinone reductase-like Zn-dependent oxidoreductase